jgi:glycosyltransferase involved in cell wall biosynthesis
MSAWITGVLASEAPYIGFVDSDDWIEPEMYRTLYQYMVEKGADIVTCCMYKNYPGQEIKVGPKETEVFEGNQIRERLIPKLLTNWSIVDPRIQNMRWDKLFRRELIVKNIKFGNTSISSGEDLNIVFAALLDAQKVVCVGNKYLYHYRKGIESITSNHNTNLLQNNIALINTLRQIADVKCYRGKELNLHSYYAYYEALCCECLSERMLKEKIIIMKRIMNDRPLDTSFVELRAQFLKGISCSKTRKLTLFLLSHRLWIIWLIGTHVVRKTALAADRIL